jgi:hypothetical protein
MCLVFLQADLLASLKDSSEVSSHWTLPSAGAGASLSEHRFKSPPASTMPDPWLSNNPPILPPPPSKVSQQQQQQQQQQQLSSLTAAEAAAVSTDPWLSTSPEINLGIPVECMFCIFHPP